MSSRFILVILVFLAIIVPTVAQADTKYDDCRLCKDLPQAGIVSNSICDSPKSGENGFVGCSERWSLFGMLCIDGRIDCIYMCIGPGCPDSGGGDTGGSGGGGSNCTGTVSYCPPECFNCGGSYY